MAIALHNVTKLPIGGLYDKSGDCHHAFVMTGDGRGIDARGMQPLEKLARGCPGTEVRLLPLADIENRWLGRCLAPSEINAAKAEIKRNAAIQLAVAEIAHANPKPAAPPIMAFSGSKGIDAVATRTHNGVVLYFPEIVIHRGRPDKYVIAAIGHSDDNGAHQQRVTVCYDFSRLSWCVVLENWAAGSKSRKIETLPRTLAGALTAFEDKVGVSLPAITVFEPNVGIYFAKEKPDPQHPLRLKVGQLYEVTDVIHGTRLFQVDAKQRNAIVFQDSTGTPITGAIDMQILSLDEWKSLRVVEPVADVPARRRHAP